MADNITKINPKEFAAAEDAAKDSKSFYTHTFRTPLVYEGNTYTELSFDFDKLTVQDSLDIEEELQRLGKPVIVTTFSGDYQIRLAAKACTVKIGEDAFIHMPLRDGNRIRSAVRSFLLTTES